MILKDFSAGGIFKLAPTGYMAAVLRDGKPHTNAGKMSCEVVITTQDEDRSGDVVITKGIDLSDHRRNPVALLNHDKDAPIGQFEDRLGNYTVKMRGDNQLVGEIFFHQNSELACDVFRAIEHKVFRGVSIGFMPVLGKIEKRHERGHIYHASKMVEGSILSIGDNQNAIIEAVHKGFGNKPLCGPLLSILRQQIPADLPECVTSGWEVKGGTYKMAEPKECEAMSRSSTYYTCPHCGEEMTHESIFKDDDGTTRHGPCRGAVVLKEPSPQSPEPIVGSAPITKDDSNIVTPISQALASSKTVKLTPRFLPGLRRKQMGYDENTDNDEFMPVDDAGGDEGGKLKAGAEFMHGLNDIIMQAFQYIADGQGSIDNPVAMKVANRVSGILSKAKSALHTGYAGYKSEHPDQPDLLGADDGGMEEFSGDGDDLDDEDDLDAELDDGDGDEGDEKTEKKPKKKKSESDDYEKAASEWRCKTLNSYWEGVKRLAVIGDAPVVKSAIASIASIRDDKTVPRAKRLEAKEIVKSLSGLLTKDARPVEAEVNTPDDPWDAFFNATEGTMN